MIATESADLDLIGPVRTNSHRLVSSSDRQVLSAHSGSVFCISVQFFSTARLWREMTINLCKCSLTAMKEPQVSSRFVPPCDTDKTNLRHCLDPVFNIFVLFFDGLCQTGLLLTETGFTIKDQQIQAQLFSKALVFFTPKVSKAKCESYHARMSCFCKF